MKFRQRDDLPHLPIRDVTDLARAVVVSLTVVATTLTSLACRNDQHETTRTTGSEPLSFVGGGAYISVDDVSFWNETVPCLGMQVAATPWIDLAALQGHTQDPQYGIDFSIAVDTQVELSTGGQVVHTDRRIQTIAAGTSTFAPMNRLEFAWDGTDWVDDQLQIAAAGSYNMNIQVSVVRIEFEGSMPLVTAVLDTVSAVGSTEVKQAPNACIYWVNNADTFGSSSQSTIVIEGDDSNIRPQVTWFAGRARRLFGNLEQRTGGEAYDATVRRFLITHGVLLGDPTIPTISGIEEEQVLVGADGFVVVRMRQVVPGTDIRVESSVLSAVFDSTGAMLRLFGQIEPNAASQTLSPNYSAEDAMVAVLDHLASSGLPTNRELNVLESVMVEDSLGSLDLAYSIAVDAVEGSADSTSYRYVVSATNGGVTDVERTAHAATGEVWDRDPSLFVPLDAQPADPPLIGTRDWILAHKSFVVSDTSSGVRLKDTHSGGVISQVKEIALTDAEPVWPAGAQDLSQYVPSGLNVTKTREILTLYSQMHQFWNMVDAWFDGDWSVDVEINVTGLTSDGDPVNGVFDGGDTIRFDGTFPIFDYLPSRVYLGVHELFHAIDHHHVELARYRRDEDERRMPGAINEGLAEWAATFADGMRPSLDGSNAGRSVACIVEAVVVGLGGESSGLCLQFEQYYMRRGFAHTSGRPWMADPEGTFTWPQWPDCRTTVADVNSYCPYISVPLPGMAHAPQSSLSQAWDFTRPAGVDDEYDFVPMVLVRAWETTATLVYGRAGEVSAQAFVSNFPGLTMRAYTLLDSRPSLVDLEDAILDVAAFSNGMPVRAVILHGIRRSFAQHGVDDALRIYCADVRSEGDCY